ncbi:Gp37-like protein [Corynebacterium sp. H113]
MTPLDVDQAQLAMQAAFRLRVPPVTRIDLWTREGYAGTVGAWEKVDVRWSSRGQAVFTIRGNDPLAALVRKCRKLLVRVRVWYGDIHWDGRVFTTRDHGVGSDWRVDVECVGVEKILDGLLVYPEPLIGIEWAQVLRKAVFTGPVVTGLLGTIAMNVQRLQRPHRQLGIPIDVLPVNPIFDGSPWRTWAVAMEPVSQLADEMLKDAQGWRLRVRQWLPGDPKPHPLWIHTTPRIVIDCVQAPWMYGVGGGHTIFSSLARELATFVGDAVGWIAQGSSRHLSKRWDELINGKPVPSVIWQQDCGGVLDAVVDNQHPTAAAAVVGGAAPDWLNTLIQDGSELAVTRLLAGMGIVMPGLGGIVGKALTNRVGTYQRTVDWQTLLSVGPEAIPETFQSTSAALTLDAMQTARTALFEAAPQTFTELTVMDGMPWRFGEDYDIGDAAGWWHMDGELYVGPVTRVDLGVSREDGEVTKTSIGTPPVVAPGEQARRIASGALTMVNALSLKY